MGLFHCDISFRELSWMIHHSSLDLIGHDSFFQFFCFFVEKSGRGTWRARIRAIVALMKAWRFKGIPMRKKEWSWWWRFFWEGNQPQTIRIYGMQPQPCEDFNSARNWCTVESRKRSATCRNGAAPSSWCGGLGELPKSLVHSWVNKESTPTWSLT